MMTKLSTGLPISQWNKALAHSRYLCQLLGAHPEAIHWLTEHVNDPLQEEDLVRFLENQPDQSAPSLKLSLRKLRQHVMAHLIIRDLCHDAPLSEIMASMSLLADFVVNHALGALYAQLVEEFGAPLDERGSPQRLMVIGMGKLGGRELNVSSDIDLIFIYPEDGHTAGAPTGGRRLENYDFFVRLGKRLITMLDELTGDGLVFRVDMRLRPNGDSGPLVCSIGSLENYFISQGREWERYAWIKARVLNCGQNQQPEWENALQKTIRPFVYRKYLDFGAINAMNELHAQIRREIARKGMDENIKLGPGGIREIEFIAQVFQLIRAGRDSALQCHSTLKALDLLAERRLLPTEDVQELMGAYEFLRRLEHRLQYVQDAQTHQLPDSDEEKQKIAASMGYADWALCLVDLNHHRQRVSHHFEQIFSETAGSSEKAEKPDGLAALWLEETDSENAKEALTKIGFLHPEEMLLRLKSFRSSTKYQQLPVSNRERLDAVGAHLIAASSKSPSPDITWQRLLDFIEAISRRGAYLAFLQQHPMALSKVAQMIGSSAWAAGYLTRHPILLDELLDPRLYDTNIDWHGFKNELCRRLGECDADTEREMDVLREMHHAQVFRLLAQDIAGLLTVEKLSDRLTELADLMVQATLDLCWKKLRAQYSWEDEPPRFAVIAYGKLGGKELSYGSDLDLVFLHDDPGPGAGERYAKLGQRVSTWMSTQTSAGRLFDPDFRLRPNGEAGLFVCPVEAFETYQSSQAWTWEHQALTRARFCAGSIALGERFEEIRVKVLKQERALDKLRTEVIEMRQRMWREHASKDEAFFDIKQDSGGLVDVEFIVQYLVLGYAHRYPELCHNLGNIALLGIAGKLGLIPPSLVAPAQEAYREFRRLQHNFRLNGNRHTRVDRDAYEQQIASIKAMWNAVFGEIPTESVP